MMIVVLTKKACVKKRVCSLKPVSKENSPKVHKKMTQNQNQKKKQRKKNSRESVVEEEEDR